MSEEPPKPIEAVFRNGSVTVVGVVVGFSLTYLTSWASRPSPWQLHDLIAIAACGRVGSPALFAFRIAPHEFAGAADL